MARAGPPQEVFAQILAGLDLQATEPRVVGVNLVQPEDAPVAVRDFSLQMDMLDFLRPLYPAAHISLHAGELSDGMVPPDVLRFHIRESVRKGHAARIGHGADAMLEDDPYSLMRELASKKVLVEIALTSNDAILGVKGARHPLRTYLQYGVPVALTTDDYGVARSSHTLEWLKAAQEQGLDYLTMKRMISELDRVLIRRRANENKAQAEPRERLPPVRAAGSRDEAVIDSHCHLADEVFAADLDAVIARARAAGLERALTILSAGDEKEAAQAERVAALWPESRFAIGVHPHSAKTFADAPEQAAHVVRQQLTRTPGARAIGEIGLDYHYDFAPADLQQQVFRGQVALARELGLPVVIHTREADDDTVRILREEGRGEVRGVLALMYRAGQLAGVAGLSTSGFYISLSGIVTFPKAARPVARPCATVLLDRLLIETDSPFLAPVPHRGGRNEPAHVGARGRCARRTCAWNLVQKKRGA